MSCILATLMTIAVVFFMTAARADPDCRIQPGKLRYEDNIDCFHAPHNHKTIPGLFKFIPLNHESDASLSIGGEVRQRYEYTHNPLFGEDPQDESGVWLQRYTLYLDWRLGPHFRLFSQFSSALETGRAAGPSPVDQNDLALQNAFIDVVLAPADGVALILRPGIQELQYGSGRLVDVREGPNVRRTFEAARVLLDVPGWRIDGLVARPRVPRPGFFDDKADKDQALWGVYATGGGHLLPFGNMDFYYLGFEDKMGAYVQGTAREVRHSLGVRFYGAERGWDWNWEAVYQFGNFGEGHISAWTIASETGFTFAEALWQPRLALSANIASGDGNPDDVDLGTFNPLFPRGNYFSEAAVLGPRNFYNFHAFVTVHPGRVWSFTADINAFWRLKTQDGVYAPSGQLIRGPSGSDKRFVGAALSFNFTYEFRESLTFTAIYTRFFAGGFIRASGPSADIDFFEATVQFRF